MKIDSSTCLRIRAWIIEIKMSISRILIILTLVVFSGCVTLPEYSVSSYDYQKIEEELRVKALKTKIERTVRVHEIAYKLLRSVPLDEKKYDTYVGLLVTPIDQYVSQLYSLSQDDSKVLVFGVVDGSPAQKAGLKNGDIIETIDGRKVSVRNLDDILVKLKADQTVNVVVLRDKQKITAALRPEKIRFNIPFTVSDSSDINAFASPKGITVMYGFLNFAQSDDELAVVLAHEMAHLIRGHLLKGSGVGLFSTILAIAIGQTDIPQAGDLGNIMGTAVDSGFSRNFEREADFYGILYAHKAGFDPQAGMAIWERFAIEMPQSMDTYFGATHPTSTERLLRIKDIISKLDSGEINESEYLMN